MLLTSPTLIQGGPPLGDAGRRGQLAHSRRGSVLGRLKRAGPQGKEALGYGTALADF